MYLLRDVGEDTRPSKIIYAATRSPLVTRMYRMDMPGPANQLSPITTRPFQG